jgi:nitrate reductase NapE component
MATYTPPPYFPQGSLAPPDKRRYRKFKLLMTLFALIILGVIGAVGYGVWYLIKWLL